MAEGWGIVANSKDGGRKSIRSGEKLWVARLNVGNGCDRNLMRSNRAGLEKWVRADRLTNFRPAFIPPTLAAAYLDRYTVKERAADQATMLNIITGGDPLAIRRWHIAAWRDAGSPGHPG